MEFNIVEALLNMTLLGTEWVLWLLIASSILSVALVIERLVFYWKIRIDFNNFTKTLADNLVAGKVDELEKFCQEKPSLESNVVLTGLTQRDNGPQAMEDSMSSCLLGERQTLDRGLVILGTLGNNAPFIGLFGTVLGIIQAFNDLAANPAGGPSVVMAGISEALVATAVGLLVAIPAVIAFNGFNRTVKRHVNNSESLMKIVLSHYKAT